MVFLKKLKEVLISVLPIVAIVLLLHFFVVKFDTTLLIHFFIATVLLVVGEVFFLTGVDSTIMPMGQMVGANSNKVSNLALFLFYAFLFGMFATVAEPDCQTLAGEISRSGINLNATALLFIIGAGVGLFMAFALLRIAKRVPIRIMFLVSFVLIFVVATFSDQSFLAIAFDSGGATIGIVTTPFVLSLTSGIVNKNGKNSKDNFGVIGIAGLGPVVAILILSLFLRGNSAEAVVASSNYSIFVQVLYGTFMAIVPLVALFYIFQIIYIKLPKKKKVSLFVGVLVTFVGLYMFLFSINFGLLQMGSAIGSGLAEKNIYIVLIIYAMFAFSIVFTEPAIRVLGAEIEAQTQGNVNRKIVIIAIAIGVTLAVIMSALRIYFDINIWYFLGVGYGIIAVLMILCDPMFVAIAFDAGGVAGGPIGTALLMPSMIALSGTANGGFGFIALASMMPVLMLEIIGVYYNIKVKGISKNARKILARISYGADKYSNMTKLEARYKEIRSKAKNEKR